PKWDNLGKDAFGWKGISGKDAAFISFAISIGVLFRLLDRTGLAPNDGKKSEYPHPAVRSNLVVSKSFGLAVQAGRFKIADFEELVAESLVGLELIWRRLGLPGQRLGPTDVWANQVRSLSFNLERE